jgi:uncharacterized NAD(P)/FAD-binding protein YdhS
LARIGIIGGGASGVLAAIHCLRANSEGDSIWIFEPNEFLGRGKAYGTCNPNYLLNVPAEKMTAYSDDPEHFVKWIAAKHSHLMQSKHWPYVPRQLFAQYLHDELKKLRNQNFSHIRERVCNVSQSGHGYLVAVESGKNLISTRSS